MNLINLIKLLLIFVSLNASAMQEAQEWNSYFQTRKTIFIMSAKKIEGSKKVYEDCENLSEQLLGSDYKEKYAEQVAREAELLNYLRSHTQNEQAAYFAYMTAPNHIFTYSDISVICAALLGHYEAVLRI